MSKNKKTKLRILAGRVTRLEDLIDHCMADISILENRTGCIEQVLEEDAEAADVFGRSAPSAPCGHEPVSVHDAVAIGGEIIASAGYWCATCGWKEVSPDMARRLQES